MLRKFREIEKPKNIIFIKFTTRTFYTTDKGMPVHDRKLIVRIREGSFIVPYINIGNRQDGREKCSNVVSVNDNARNC